MHSQAELLPGKPGARVQEEIWIAHFRYHPNG